MPLFYNWLSCNAFSNAHFGFPRSYRFKCNRNAFFNELLMMDSWAWLGFGGIFSRQYARGKHIAYSGASLISRSSLATMQKHGARQYGNDRSKQTGRPTSISCFGGPRRNNAETQCDEFCAASSSNQTQKKTKTISPKSKLLRSADAKGWSMFVD